MKAQRSLTPINDAVCRFSQFFAGPGLGLGLGPERAANVNRSDAYAALGQPLLFSGYRDLHTPHSTVKFRMTFSDLEWLNEIFNDTNDRPASLRQLHFHFHLHLFRSKETMT